MIKLRKRSMKKLLALLATTLFTIPSIASEDVTHWTVTISKVHVNDETVKIQTLGASQPNPSSSQWSCTNGWLNLDGYSNAIAAGLKFSAAMEAYKSKTTARVGVKGSGNDCVLTYITIN